MVGHRAFTSCFSASSPHSAANASANSLSRADSASMLGGAVPPTSWLPWLAPELARDRRVRGLLTETASRYRRNRPSPPAAGRFPAATSALMTLTSPVTVTTSPFRHELTSSSVSSHSTVRGIWPTSAGSPFSGTISCSRTRCQSTHRAEGCTGAHFPLRHPSPSAPPHFGGGRNRPSGNATVASAPHFPHAKAIRVTSGLTGPVRTTVPRRATSLPIRLAFTARTGTSAPAWFASRTSTGAGAAGRPRMAAIAGGRPAGVANSAS